MKNSKPMISIGVCLPGVLAIAADIRFPSHGWQERTIGAPFNGRILRRVPAPPRNNVIGWSRMLRQARRSLHLAAGRAALMDPLDCILEARRPTLSFAWRSKPCHEKHLITKCYINSMSDRQAAALYLDGHMKSFCSAD
ncbi:MAG: hypothetical protein IT467_07395 [Dokdonella sp.]|uniref:hypothetical protein n=1 Tax=Dokdonella sp. TaxID=2291710 RepID=UPI0025C4B56A|nr:hypothetical protein [Dokdonella sp.]MBZ0221668.1 hypothetical protein [Dokdonella sp.]MCC7255742.1 hypothetical protein [Dokdonella sp.]